jgi:AcrR family transcriptional regulator
MSGPSEKTGNSAVTTQTRIRKPAGDRKADIRQAALRLAFEVGPDMVTTGMIAADLGLTQPALYKHFPHKQDIWTDVADFLTSRIGDNLARSRAAECGPVDKLRMLVIDHLRLVEQNPALPEIMVLRDHQNTRTVLRERTLRRMMEFSADLVANVSAAQKQHLFRNDFAAADGAALIFGIIQSLVLRMMMNRNPSMLVPEGERLVNLQLTGFARAGD